MVVCGAAAAAGVLLVAGGEQAGLLNPQLLPAIEWPQLPVLALAGALLALAPAALTPRPRLASEGGVR